MRARFTLLTGLVSYSAQRCTIGSQSYIMGCLQLHSCLAKKKKGGGGASCLESLLLHTGIPAHTAKYVIFQNNILFVFPFCNPQEAHVFRHKKEHAVLLP